MQAKLLFSSLTLLTFQATSLNVPRSSDQSTYHQTHDTSLLLATQWKETAASALALPPTNLTLPSTSTSRPRLKCAHRPLLPFARDTRPRFSDCIFAIGILPSTHAIGTFHSGYPPNQFELPLRRIVGSCVMEVGLKDPGAKEKARWLEVKAVVQHLIVECRVKKRGGDQVTGGWSEAGVGRGIRVRLTSSGVANRKGGGGWGGEWKGW